MPPLGGFFYASPSLSTLRLRSGEPLAERDFACGCLAAPTTWVSFLEFGFLRFGKLVCGFVDGEFAKPSACFQVRFSKLSIRARADRKFTKPMLFGICLRAPRS